MTTRHIPKNQRGSRSSSRRRQEDLHQPDTLAGGTSFYHIKNGQFTAVSCSDDLPALTGYSPDEYHEVTARDALGIIHSKDRARVKDSFMNVLSTGQPVRMACRLRGKGNLLLWVRVNLVLITQEGETFIFASFSRIKGNKAPQCSADETRGVCHTNHASCLKSQQISWIESQSSAPYGSKHLKKKRFRLDTQQPKDTPHTLVQRMSAGIMVLRGQSQHQLIRNSYDLILAINPEQDQFWQFSLESARVFPVQRAGNLSALKNQFLNEEVLPCDREKCRKMLDVSYMNQQLEKKSFYSFHYLVRIGNTVRAKNAIVFRMSGQSGWTCFARSDITDSLQEQQALFRTLAQTFEVFALISPDADSCVLYTRKTVLGSQVPEFFTGLTSLVEKIFFGCKIETNQQEMLVQSLSSANMLNRLADEPHGYSFVTAVHEDHQLHYKHVSITWDDPTQKSICVVRTDITLSIREEAKQTQLLRSALATERDANRAKQDFLSIMSHDIRTPMNAIVGMASLAMTHRDNPAQLEECLRIIKDSSNHLRNLIGDILDMGRIESGRMVLSKVPFSQTEQLQMVAERTQILAEKKEIQFHYSVQLEHDTCVGDPVRIDQILENLLGNAVKFTPAGGSVTLDLVELPHPNKQIGWFCYTISDTGIGMSQETMQHLYDPFYREKSDQVSQIEGSGLGLSIVRNLVDYAGGVMDVSSSSGQGTQFIINLPLMFASVDEVTTLEKAKLLASSSPCNQCLKNCRILLVEDHPINRIVAERLLEDVGATITIAKNGLVGLETFRSSVPGFFDAVLMDLRMPIMDGYAAARSIRACQHPQAKKIPIIAMTANAFAQDVQHCLDAGMNAHVAKPVDQNRLLAVLLQFISK